MPQSTRDEILFKYASIIRPELVKVAWGWNDLVTTFGLDALGLGAGATIGEATGAGALTGALSIGSGGVIPLIIGTALTIGGLAYGIYSLVKLTDDNLESLIKRLDALDGDKQAQPIINGWMKKLETYKQSLNMPLAVGTSEERARVLSTQLAMVKQIVAYLKGIQRDWLNPVKPHLTDWGKDPAEAEVAINKTTAALEAQAAKLEEQFKENTQKAIQEISQKSGQNYEQTANELSSLFAQVTQLNDNKAPGLNPREAYAWALVQKILGKDESNPVTQQELTQGFPLLHELRTALQEAAKYLSEKQSKKSDNRPPLSKRSLTLADGKQIGHTQVPVGGTLPMSSRKGNETVLAVQKLINSFRKYIPDEPSLRLDGVYGVHTSESLAALTQKMPELKNYLETYVGLTQADLSNYDALNKDAEKINGIYKALEQVYKEKVGKAPWETAQQEKQAPAQSVRQPNRCPVGKNNMNNDEIVDCLMTGTIQEQGRPPMRSDEWLMMWGYTTPEQMAQVVRDTMESQVSGSSGNWIHSMDLIRDHVLRTHHNIQNSPGQVTLIQ